MAWLFGQNWADYLKGGMPDQHAGVLFTLLAEFNNVILAGMACYFLYVLSVGMVGTSHEGTPLGKRYHTVWTPVRFGFGVCLLMPIPGVKLSVIQGAILLGVSQSIGLANTMWTTALDHMGANGGIVSYPAKTVSSSIYDVAKQGFINLTYQEYVRQRLHGTISTPWTISRQGSSSDWIIVFAPPIAEDVSLSSADMGRIRIPCVGAEISSVAADAACAARKEGVVRMLEYLRSAAGQMVSENTPQVPASLVTQAIQSYTSANTAAIDSFVNQIDGSEYSRALNDFINAARQQGWVSAGSWYWTIAKFQEKASIVAEAHPTFVEAGMHELTNEAGTLKADWEAYLNAANNYFENSIALNRDQLRHIAQGADRKNANSVWAWLAEPFTTIDFTEELTAGDPVARLQSLGNKLIVGVEFGYVTYATFRGVARAGSENIVSKVVSVMPGVYEFLVAMIVPIVVLLGPLALSGFTLAYYLPAVPYILWLSAVVAWLILVFEALVAGPLWAAAHAMPDGDGPVAEHAHQGYMLFFSILFRPPLMVIGFFFAMVLMVGAGFLVGKTFAPFIGGLRAGATFSGLVTWVALTVMLAIIMIVLAHKIYGLITWLADNVLQWIGQHIKNLGEHHDEERIRALFGAAVHTGASTATGSLRQSRSRRKPPGSGDTKQDGADLNLAQGHRTATNQPTASGNDEAFR